MTNSTGASTEAMRRQAEELAAYRDAKRARDAAVSQVAEVLVDEWEKWFPPDTMPRPAQWAHWLSEHDPLTIERAVQVAAAHFTRSGREMSYEHVGRYVSAVLRNWERDQGEWTNTARTR